MRVIRSFFCDEEAATAVEYAIMLASILLVIIAAIASFGDATSGLFSSIDNDMKDHGIK